jgi:hypothetical protein
MDDSLSTDRAATSLRRSVPNIVAAFRTLERDGVRREQLAEAIVSLSRSLDLETTGSEVVQQVLNILEASDAQLLAARLSTATSQLRAIAYEGKHRDERN